MGGVRVPPASGRDRRACFGAQASFRPPLMPDWLRESDASAKEAQVGQLGGVTSQKGR